LLADENGYDLLTMVVKATYDIHTNHNSITIAHEQAPIVEAGEYYGDPTATSIKYATEADYIKLGTDVALVGHAYAQQDGVTQLDVRLRVGPVVKELRVYGDRCWQNYIPSKGESTEGSQFPQPEPITKVPLVYERAFGGEDTSLEDETKHEFDKRNPVGMGIVNKHSDDPVDIFLPNIEDPRYPLKNLQERPPPAGFGYISPHWEPRVQFAGTYDEQWEKERMPMLPKDFDQWFFNAAHPELISRQYLQGREQVEVSNAGPESYMYFQLPEIKPQGVVRMKNGDTYHLDMNLDTVVINADEKKLFLTWRRSMSIYKNINNMLWGKTEIVKVDA
jgi:hypothetical protein